MRKELPRNSKGQKLYPVCSWEKNQHKIDNAYTRASNAQYDAFESGDSNEINRAEEWFDTVERLYGIFNSQVIDGLVYATWQDGQHIKNIIHGYDARH